MSNISLIYNDFVHETCVVEVKYGYYSIGNSFPPYKGYNYAFTAEYQSANGCFFILVQALSYRPVVM